VPCHGKRKKKGKKEVMTTHRKHTPIVSEAQRGLFGAEYARRKKGLTPRMRGITKTELKGHLKESKGKNLVSRVKKKSGSGWTKAGKGVIVR